MKELKIAVRKLETEELIRANKEFPLFASDHEAYAVIKEEIEEAEAELERVKAKLDMVYWLMVKNNDDDAGKMEVLEQMRTKAMLGACEMIQVSAMCEKAIVSICERVLEDEDIHLG